MQNRYSTSEMNKNEFLSVLKVHGRAWHSIPAEYPVEKDIAKVYTEVGEENFTTKAKDFLEFRSLLREAKTPGELEPLIEGQWPGRKENLYNIIRSGRER